MRQSEGSRHAYKSWQLLSRRMHQLWRQKHGRVILIAPVALLLLTIAWSSPSSVSPLNYHLHYSHTKYLYMQYITPITLTHVVLTCTRISRRAACLLNLVASRLSMVLNL